MSLRPLVAALLVTGSAPVLAQTFDVNLSDDAAQFAYVAPMGQQGFGQGHVDGRVLFTDNDAFLGALGFGVVGDAGSGSPGLQVGVGVRAYGVNTDNGDVVALALGGRFEFAPPPLPRLRIGAEVNYAPNIVTFVDGDRFYDNSAYVGYEIFQDAVAYLGVRRIHASIEDAPNVTVDKGAYLGVRLQF